MVLAVKLLLATLPAKRIDKVLPAVREMYPVVPAENVLATSLNNLNPIVHPVVTVMNAAWVDTLGKDFYLYRHGTTLSTARGIKAVFEEVYKVAEAVGARMLEYPEDDFWRKSTIMSTYFRKLAMKLKVDTPVIEAVITLAFTINQTDYMAEGLGLEDLGIWAFDRYGLVRFLERGEG